MLLGLADYSRKRRQKREGMRRQRSRVGGGVSATAARALKQDKTSGGTPPYPSSQMNISACLLPRLHLWVFSSPPLFISMLPVPSTQLQLPLQQICRAPSSSLHLPSIQSWAWRIQAGPFLLLRRKLSPL